MIKIKVLPLDRESDANKTKIIGSKTARKIHNQKMHFQINQHNNYKIVIMKSFLTAKFDSTLQLKTQAASWSAFNHMKSMI